MNHFRLIMSVLLGLAAVLGIAVQSNWQNNVLLARQHFVATAHGATLRDANRLEVAVRSIYQNLGTLSLIPSIRGLDRHGENLSLEGRVTIQQIFENLNSNIDVAEIYVVPIDFNPERMDPQTLRPEQPILKFSKHPEIAKAAAETNSATPWEAGRAASELPDAKESEEAQLVEQAAWLKGHYPEKNSSDAKQIPFVAGPEVVARDSLYYSDTIKDPNPSGIIFSVPFYGLDGNIKGSISAVILNQALRELMPSDTLALVNPGNGYVMAGAEVTKMTDSTKFVASATSDPNLIYSEVQLFGVRDYRNPWYVWSGQPDATFYNSEEFRTAGATRRSGFLMLAIYVIAAGVCIALLARNANQAAALAKSMRSARDLAQASEAEAQASAETFKTLNNDISRLNRELADRLSQLTEAQEDIVKKGRMAQLGNLVATVAHELRNPLAGVRTTVFLLQRKLKNSSIDVSSQLQRIEQGVVRCDMIITQLLDFSRTQPANTSEIDMVSWLQSVLQEEAAKLPAQVTLKYHVSEPSLVVAIDPERMRRGVVNLVANASEAMTSGDGPSKMKEEPTVTVTLREASGVVELIISDNGPGITPEVLAKIGEPLFTTKSFGTGLGVAAVRKVAELHGGGLRMKSTLGAGAAFTLWFPLARAAQAAS